MKYFLPIYSLPPCSRLLSLLEMGEPTLCDLFLDGYHVQSLAVFCQHPLDFNSISHPHEMSHRFQSTSPVEVSPSDERGRHTLFFNGHRQRPCPRQQVLDGDSDVWCSNCRCLHCASLAQNIITFINHLYRMSVKRKKGGGG